MGQGPIQLLVANGTRLTGIYPIRDQNGRQGNAKAKIHLCIAGGDYTLILTGKWKIEDSSDRVPKSKIGDLWPESLLDEINGKVTIGKGGL